MESEISKPAGKRRRINTAASILSKPFRSPFITPITTATSSDVEPFQSHDSNAVTEDDSKGLLPIHVFSKASPTRLSLQKKASHSWSSPMSTARLNNEPEIAHLLRIHRQLEKQMRELKEELDIAEQAQKIETKTGGTNQIDEVDDELLHLIQKWKVASQQAAEELFGGVRDRVNRMGGPKAWKEMERQQKEFQSGFDDDPLHAGPNYEAASDGEKRDFYAEYDICPETENEREARGGYESTVDEAQQDEFTMAMMLRKLNIDPKAIGYDSRQQCWV